MAEKKKESGDFIAHGSPEHAALLGLRKADKDDAIQYEGWTLVDLTMFGPQVTEAYLREVIRQKVYEMRGGTPKVPDSAPAMWVPKRIAP